MGCTSQCLWAGIQDLGSSAEQYVPIVYIPIVYTAYKVHLDFWLQMIQVQESGMMLLALQPQLEAVCRPKQTEDNVICRVWDGRLMHL